MYIAHGCRIFDTVEHILPSLDEIFVAAIEDPDEPAFQHEQHCVERHCVVDLKGILSLRAASYSDASTCAASQ